MKKISLLRIIIATAPLVMTLPFAMDIYVPAIPHITSVLGVNTATMQLTLNLFMLISGIAQLFWGPITDQYGRKHTCFYLVFIFSLGILVCASAGGIVTLLIGRIIEAIGSSGLMVIAFSVGRDLYSGTKLAKLYSIINGIISFSPMFAPFIGSYLDLHFGWASTFEGLWVFSVLTFVLYFPLLPETLPKSKRQPITLNLLKQYKMILHNRVFLLYTLASAMGLSYLYIFCAISSVIIITLLHIPEKYYGFYFCFMGISFFLGSLISTMVVGKLGIYKTVLTGFAVTLVGGISMLAWYLYGGLSISDFIYPMLILGIGGTMCLGAGSAGCVIPFDDNVGLATALAGSCRFLYAAVIGLIVTRHITSTLPLALPAIICSMIGIILFLSVKRLKIT